MIGMDQSSISRLERGLLPGLRLKRLAPLLLLMQRHPPRAWERASDMTPYSWLRPDREVAREPAR
jgi:hypothetical protein